jgi:glycosyltransferase involved in cell wall biosynthesis
MKVCIFTSVHKPDDVRVFHREAVTLAAAGHDVTLLAPADFAQEKKNGVTIKGIPRPTGRLARLTGLLKFYRLCKNQNSDVYHFHDFELLFIGWLIKKRLARAVIYDCHENYPETAYERVWLPAWSRPLFSRFIAWLEPTLARSLDAVVCVVPDQQARLQQAGCKTALIRNLPRLEVFEKAWQSRSTPRQQIIYLGGLSEVRGAFTLVDIMVDLKKTHPHIHLLCLGSFNEPAVEAAVKQYAHRSQVSDVIEYSAPIPHEQVAAVLAASRIGLIPWQPSLQTTKMVYPNKVFEYMACGLPLVSSDLPSLVYIMEKAQSGLLVKARDVHAHAEAIRRLLDNPHEAQQLGENGRQFVFEQHNWHSEALKLTALYDNLARRSNQ